MKKLHERRIAAAAAAAGMKDKVGDLMSGRESKIKVVVTAKKMQLSVAKREFCEIIVQT